MDNAVILAGGQGKRMKADMPKPLFRVLGEPMLEWVIGACEGADIKNLCVVKGYMGEMIDEYLGGRYETVLQAERLGTGHAVMQAIPFLQKNTDGNTLVLCGDAPFIDSRTISDSLEMHKKGGNAVTVITAELDNPFGYGRIIRTENGISSIVEEKDATPEQKMIKEINSGAYWFRTADLIESLGLLTTDNSQGEYYLTDTIYILLEKGKKADAFKSENPNVVLGANDRKGLLMLNKTAREDIISRHLENGVEFTCTDGITIGRDVVIGAGTQILSGTVLSGKTVIGTDCVIGPDCIIENSTVGNGTKLNYVQCYESRIDNNVKIGPFVQVRPGSHIKDGVKIGDFVEVKNSVIGEETAVAHLTYVGDSDVGGCVNFGCGVVTVNYDGEKKSRCTIEDNAFIGCNTNLIAPVKVGKGAYTAAGSTITKDVPADALAIERGETRTVEGYAARKLRNRKKK
ncbi:MAG: bifunctional UDP-N-acetylglucosamine diphosphorylase/glucosamine-1-phosphate N-acetyltransferase GlmU [Oscillospiraceae bacterium]|nr:bifunctional UDP-N-acetylglucosamine diphosphorylase/glucosamine-1-phosphate N-acetyltransferase GlmU [Oscillospiraceae bacterium]